MKSELPASICTDIESTVPQRLQCVHQDASHTEAADNDYFQY